MHGIRKALLFTIGIAVAGTGTSLGQRGAVGARTALPSSTAIGAGALSAFPSSTSRATAPAFGRSGYLGARTYSRSTTPSRQYRPLPRAYVFAPYYYPFFDWSGATDYSAYSGSPYDDSGYAPPYGPDPGTDAMMMNQAALGQQVQRLTDQLNGMMYGQQAPQQAAASDQPPPVPLTLVLRSGEQLQVQNYAVTNNTFWDFTQRGTRKIPLSNIDLAASAKATQANGGEFPQIDGTQ